MRRSDLGLRVGTVASIFLLQVAVTLARPVSTYRLLALGADGTTLGLTSACFAVPPMLLAVGFGLGAVAIQGLHAQAKPPVYYIGEIDVTNADAYAKEYQPGAGATIKAAGGRYLAAGKAVPIEGAPPQSRVILLAWDSMEALQAWRDSAALRTA